MTTNVGQIKNPQIFVNPSDKLKSYISNIKVGGDDLPNGIKTIVYKNKSKDTETRKILKLEYLVTDQDKKFINSLNLDSERIRAQSLENKPSKSETPSKSAKLLSLHDLQWMYYYIQAQNLNSDEKVYLHELMEGSEIVLPKNEEIPRSQELDKRCQRLKAEQQNKEYDDMTKNVDNSRRKLPEDTIGYQLKMMNRHLIAVFQFILSVATGFAFGFIGMELLVGSLDFGFRLLLGIICALIVALAELYFLAKKLNEDMEFEFNAKRKTVKID